MSGYGPVRRGRVNVTWVKPPVAASSITEVALGRRAKLPPSRRGGLSKSAARRAGITSGVERAESISRGDLQPAEDVVAFFRRFRSTYEDSLDKPWERSKVQQAWDLWGGQPMWDSAEKALRAGNPDPQLGLLSP